MSSYGYFRTKRPSAVIILNVTDEVKLNFVKNDFQQPQTFVAFYGFYAKL